MARGFTLIELLIVIAIILILIAIALPNFLDAQIRAKLTRSRADLRTISIAMHSYFIDFGIFPPDNDPSEDEEAANGLNQLTSPLRYLSILPHDAFGDPSSGVGSQRDEEFTFEMGSTGLRPRALLVGFWPPLNLHAFVVYSYGPDNFDNFLQNDRWPFPRDLTPCGDVFATSYSPTNGTRSLGDLMEFGESTGAEGTASTTKSSWAEVQTIRDRSLNDSGLKCKRAGRYSTDRPGL